MPDCTRFKELRRASEDERLSPLDVHLQEVDLMQVPRGGIGVQRDHRHFKIAAWSERFQVWRSATNKPLAPRFDLRKPESAVLFAHGASVQSDPVLKMIEVDVLMEPLKGPARIKGMDQIGRASCRERVAVAGVA